MKPVRIISGQYKNRRLFVYKNHSVRPLMNRVKEWIFDIIRKDVKSAKVLDLFAGSGSFGLEACSHYASYVCFVDKMVLAKRAIKKNIQNIKVSEAHLIVQRNVLSFVEQKSFAYDIVFCDPPYDFENIESFLIKIVKNKIVETDGILIIEHHVRVKLNAKLDSFTLFRSKRFGKTMISIYSRES